MKSHCTPQQVVCSQWKVMVGDGSALEAGYVINDLGLLILPPSSASHVLGHRSALHTSAKVYFYIRLVSS